MCLPDVPHYFGSVGSVSQTVEGVEYNNHPAGLQHHNVPCAVCYSSLRATVMMIPGAVICPPSWTTEYNGYLMNDGGNGRSRNECVDRSPESIPGLNTDQNGHNFNPMAVNCNNAGIACPPYTPNGVLTCAVCSR